MNVRNLLIALLVILTQLHTSVAQTPTPPDARIGPPQFAHGTKLMYAFNDMSSIPDGSVLKWGTFYYRCESALITRTSTIGVPFVFTASLQATPYEGEQVQISYGNDPNDPVSYYFTIPPIAIYTKTTLLFIPDRRIRSFVSDEMSVTLDIYKYAYNFSLIGSSTANTASPYPEYCQIFNIQSLARARFAYLPPIVGINAFLPNVNRP